MTFNNNIFFYIFLIALFLVFGFIDALRFRKILHESQGEIIVDDISESCLDCICEATSLCDYTLGCKNGVCGMFALTKDYWDASGRPTLQWERASDEKFAFQRCATDMKCARLTIKMYMDLYSWDCNNDGFIDCMDYASMHRLGKLNCDKPLDYDYKNKLYQCLVKKNETFVGPVTTKKPENKKYKIYKNEKIDEKDKNEKEDEKDKDVKINETFAGPGTTKKPENKKYEIQKNEKIDKKDKNEKEDEKDNDVETYETHFGPVIAKNTDNIKYEIHKNEKTDKKNKYEKEDEKDKDVKEVEKIKIKNEVDEENEKDQNVNEDDENEYEYENENENESDESIYKDDESKKEKEKEKEKEKKKEKENDENLYKDEETSNEIDAL